MQIHVGYNFNSSVQRVKLTSDRCNVHCAALSDKNVVPMRNIKYTRTTSRIVSLGIPQIYGWVDLAATVQTSSRNHE